MSLSKDDKIKMLAEDLERSIETGDMELHERTRLEFYNMTACGFYLSPLAAELSHEIVNIMKQAKAKAGL